MTVVTSVYSKSDIETRNKLIDNQLLDGVKLKIINVVIDNRHTFIRRIWSFFLYGMISSYYAFSLSADVVIASSGPITVGLPGLVARHFRRRPLIFEVRDLWPEGAIQLGLIKNRFVKNLAYWFERKCYEASSQIVALSPGMQSDIEERFNLSNITSISNSADMELFGKSVDWNVTLEGIPQYYAVYTGNIGQVNNSLWLLEAAKILKSRGVRDLAIVLIGEGQLKTFIQNEVKRGSIENLIVLDLMPKIRLVEYVKRSMVSLVPLKDVPILNTSSPNKFFESLAAGIPVIQNTKGWMKSFLEEYKVGFTVDGNDPVALADLLMELRDSPEILHRMGLEARKLALKYFDKDYLADRMLSVLVDAKMNP